MTARTRNRTKRSRHSQGHAIGFLVIFGAIAGAVACFCIAIVALCASWLGDLPDYEDIDLYAQSGITTIYANDRETVLATVYLENRKEVGADEISPYVFDGTVATEDERFYSHSGIDLIGLVRATIVDLTGTGSEGASTISQQLVRNTVLLDEMSDRSVKRKIREMYIAAQVEKDYSKDDILLMYLNIINYGDNCYGIETAAEDYFDTDAADLTLAQAALLVGIPQSPTANNPRTNYDNAIERQHLVLSRMLSNGYITESEYEEALAEPIVLAKKKDRDDGTSNLAPYFVDYVKQILSSDQFSASEVSKGGLSVYTTLDVSDQKAAKKAIKENLQYSELDCSLTSIDPDTGYIVAMVGGRNYDEDEFNLATQMARQAGSSFKTFTLLAAIDMGINPDSTYINSDSPAYITDKWTVNNSEGGGYGNISLTSATTSSVNTVYARLAHTIGAEPIIDMARNCGITSDLDAYESITLGTSGVCTLEMASAYATIAAGGIYHTPTAVTEIVDSRGETTFYYEPDDGERVIKAAVAQKATEILETVVTSGTGTAAQLYNGQVAAGKTGTSEGGRDLWFCGITPQLSTAIWAGYRAERETGTYGGTVCAPIWHDYMTTVLEGQETREFPTTDKEVEYTYDWTFTDGGYSSEYDYGGGGYTYSYSGGDSSEDSEEAEEKSSGGGSKEKESSGGGGGGGSSSKGGGSSGGGGGGSSGGSTGSGSTGTDTGSGSDEPSGSEEPSGSDEPDTGEGD